MPFWISVKRMFKVVVGLVIFERAENRREILKGRESFQRQTFTTTTSCCLYFGLLGGWGDLLNTLPNSVNNICTVDEVLTTKLCLKASLVFWPLLDCVSIYLLLALCDATMLPNWHPYCLFTYLFSWCPVPRNVAMTFSSTSLLFQKSQSCRNWQNSPRGPEFSLGSNQVRKICLLHQQHA